MIVYVLTTEANSFHMNTCIFDSKKQEIILASLFIYNLCYNSYIIYFYILGGKKMAWCPNCKNEYKEGISRCLDCDCDLIEQLDEMERVYILEGEESQLTRCNNFLIYNKLNSGKVERSDEEDGYRLSVIPEDEIRATKILTIFLQQEALNHESETYELQEDQNEDNSIQKEVLKKESGLYEKSTVKAKEYESTAYLLIILGFVGMVVMLLGYLDYLSLPFSNLSYIALGIFFLLFLLFGIQSLSSSKRLKEKGTTEERLEEELKNYLKIEYNKDYLEEKVQNSLGEHTASEEILYFKRIEIMKEDVLLRYPTMDESFLDAVLDEHYQELYE